MKNLIVLLALTLSLNLNGMELNKKNDTKFWENKDSYFQNIMEGLQSVLKPTLNHSNDQYVDFTDEDIFNLMREEFSEAVDSANTQKALIVLQNALAQYPKLTNESEKAHLNFAMKFIEIINLEKKIVVMNEYISEKKFVTLYNKFVSLVKEFKKYVIKSNIELDNITMSTCAGFDTSLLTLALKLAPSEMMLDFLISKNITINSADILGNTPLHILASLPENPTLIAKTKLLLENGIDSTALNNNNEEAITLALAKENNIIAELIAVANENAKRCPIKFSPRIGKRKVLDQHEYRKYVLYIEAIKHDN